MDIRPLFDDVVTQLEAVLEVGVVPILRQPDPDRICTSIDGA